MGEFLNFKEIAEAVDVSDVADFLGLKLKASSKEMRCACPTCDTEDPRSLAVYPQSNSFRCYAAEKSGDCIGLYAHIKGVGMYAAAKAIHQQFRAAPAVPAQPQKPEARTAKAQPRSAPFDPESFAKKLVFTDEVAALLSEADATRLGVGFHPQRKRVYWPIRNPDGSISGFITADNVKPPPAWIGSNVIVLRRA